MYVLSAISVLKISMFRLYKVSLPNCGDFELLFNQIKKLIEVGCKNQLQQGVDKCKSF